MIPVPGQGGPLPLIGATIGPVANNAFIRFQELETSQVLNKIENGVVTALQNWISSLGARVYVRATVTSGTMNIGTANTWQLPSVTPVTYGRNTTGTCTFTVDVSTDSAGGSILASASFTCTVT